MRAYRIDAQMDALAGACAAGRSGNRSNERQRCGLEAFLTSRAEALHPPKAASAATDRHLAGEKEPIGRADPPRRPVGFGRAE